MAQRCPEGARAIATSLGAGPAPTARGSFSTSPSIPTRKRTPSREIQANPPAAAKPWNLCPATGNGIAASIWAGSRVSALRRLRDRLDEQGFERVWAWGHPDGLRSGADRKAEGDLIAHIAHARAIGASTMRIVGGNRRTRPGSWATHFRQLRAALRRVVPAAEDAGVTLAIENHIDLTGDEMAELIEAVGSSGLGVTLDTGNNLRLFEDPVEVCRKLAPYTRATHVKDIGVWRGDPKEFSFWPSVALGDGIVDLRAVVGFLRKAKYRGLLCVEVDFLHPDHGEEDQAVRKSLAYLRRIVR
jgi:sugar phosphate isomerase/epimerase